MNKTTDAAQKVVNLVALLSCVRGTAAADTPNPCRPASSNRSPSTRRHWPNAPQPRPDWFRGALAWAREPVRGQARPLTPHASAVGAIEGDRVSDVLVQYATTHADATFRAIPEGTWQFLIDDATPTACFHLGDVAYLKTKQFAVAEQALRKVVDAGSTTAMFNHGVLLAEQERQDEAETGLEPRTR